MNEPAYEISWLHRVAAFAAVMVFFLIVLGTLVTASNPAMLAPRWPTFLDNLWRLHVNAPAYQAGYGRMAVIVSVVVPVQALWLWRSASHRYVKTLGWLAVLSLLVVSFIDSGQFFSAQPVARSLAHAATVEMLFSLTVCLALFTRTDWKWDEQKTVDIAAPSFRQLAIAATAAVFLEVVLDASAKAGALRQAPHFIASLAAIALVLWMLEIVFNKFGKVGALKIPTVLLAELAGLGFFFGLVAYSMRLNASKAATDLPGLVVMAAADSAFGSLSLAASLFVTFQAFKHLETEGANRAGNRSRPGVGRKPENGGHSRGVGSKASSSEVASFEK